MGIYGQDWASYQSATSDTSGLSFVFVKVTEGLGYTSPVWVSQRNHAKANGLVVGFYHYPHIANDPIAEADYFLKQINLAAGDILCLDWEWYGQSVSDAQARAYKTAWLARVRAKAPGHRVGVYADRTNWTTVDTDSNCGDFLWIADYVPAGQPRIQAPWLFHQYGSDPVDKDFCHLATLADLRAWALGTQSQEDDMPTAEEIANAVWSHTEVPTAGAKPVRTGAAVVWMDSVHTGQNKRLDEISTQLGGLSTTGLTDDQIQAIADKVAANPALVNAIAAAVATNIAGRLES